jgi:hypothetical protein
MKHYILQVTDWLAHVPKEAIAKNFQQKITVFDHIPSCMYLSGNMTVFPAFLIA